MLRRTGGRSARLSFADLELDEDSHEAWKAGQPVSLSPTEFQLLRYFLKLDTTEPRLLHTLRGVGYVLRLPR